MADKTRTVAIDAETLAGRSFPYQHDIAEIEDIDLMAATPGEDLNWLEDIWMLEEQGYPAVFDRYSNSFLKIYFDIPEGREDEIARKVLIAHLTPRQLVRHPAQGRPLQVSPADLGTVGTWILGCRYRLQAARARRMDTTRRTLRISDHKVGLADASILVGKDAGPT